MLSSVYMKNLCCISLCIVLYCIIFPFPRLPLILLSLSNNTLFNMQIIYEHIIKCISELFIQPYKIHSFLHAVFLFSIISISSVQFSRSVVSDSLPPHESQHARPPCPSPSPGFHSDSHPSSRWCHPAISSSVVPFSSCPQSLPASESFPMSQPFAWGGQSTGVSVLASFLPKNTQVIFRLYNWFRVDRSDQVKEK